MRPNLFVVTLLGLSLLMALPTDSGAEPTKALKYHKALLRRPAPGYLYDRFFNAWVEEESVESLAEFLRSRANDSASDGLLMAYFHAKQGDDLLAIEQFRKTLADDPGNAVAWHQKAIVEARSLNFETALADLAKARDANPPDELATRIATLRARLLVRSGDRDAALKAFAELIAQRPDDQELVEDVIELQVDEDLHAEAAKLCEQLIEKTKDPYKRLLRRLRRGDILQQGGKREAAVKVYESTLADAGADSWLEREILAQIERVYRKEEDLGGLKRQYEQLAEKYPKRVAVLRGQCRVLADSGDGKEAIEQFRKILAITPGDRDNQQEFIQLHVRIDDYAGARKQLEKLIELQPKDAELEVQLAEVAAELKDSPAVAAAVDSYLKKSDASEYAHLRAARLLDRLKQEKAAKAKYELLTESFPESRSAKEARAAFLYKTGEKEAAVELWQAAAEGGDSQQVVRVAKMLTARQENEAAYALLEEQRESLGQDPLYLAQLIDTALALKKYSEAVPLARRRVDLAETGAELEQAVSQAAKAINRAELATDLIEELAKLPSPTAQQACLLAELFDRNGDPQRADETLQPLLDKGEPLAVGQQVRLAKLRRDWDTAIAAALRALDLPDGRNSRNMRRLVEFYERAYRTEEALKRLPEWKRLSPGSSSPWLTEARLLQSEGKDAEAIEVLRQASRRLDDPREVRSRLAQLYTAAGKLADAERLYWLDYEESDDLLAKIRSVEQLARVAENGGKTEALVANFEQRRRENRTSIEPLMALAAIHRVAQNYDKRVQVLGEAAKMRPDDLQLLSQVARIQEQEGDWEAARDTLRRAAVNDKTSKTKSQLARLLIRWGESDEGYALLQAIATEQADDPREFEKLADAMVAVSDWERAVEFLSPLIERYPEDYRLRYLLAVCQEETDLPSEAADGFLSVLAADQELTKGSAQKANPRMNNWYYDELKRIAPDGLIDLFQATQNSYSAYSHRQNRGGMRVYRMGGQGMRSAVTMPISVEQAHSLALAHLGRLAQTLDDEQVEDLRESVASAGGPTADAVFVLNQGTTPQNRRIDFEALGKLTERPSVLAFLVLRGAQAPGLPDDFFPKATTQFEESHPELALIAALNGVKSLDAESEEGSALVKKAEELIASVESPSAVTISTICQWRSGLGQNRTLQAPQQLKDRVRDRIVEWYPKIQVKQNYGPWIMMQVSSILAEGDDPKPYLKFLQAEVDRYAKAPAKAGNQPNYYGHNQQTLISRPAFPPTKLRTIPPNLVGMISPRQGQQAFIVSNQTRPSWEPEALKTSLKVVTDPALKLLLAHSIDEKKLVEEQVEALLSVEPPSLDAHLLAAGWACETEAPEKALKLLTKARFLPMNRDERRSLDGSLVALVQELAEEAEDKLDDEVLQVGRDAALRLRHGRLDSQQRSLLATALTDFGLEKEADRLQKAATTTVATRPSFNMRRATPATPDQIRKLIDAGKKDAASRRLAQELRGFISQAQQQPGNHGYIRHQVQQLKTRLTQYNLLNETLDQLDPGESKAHRKHAEYATGLELLGQDNKAAAAYARALELRPKEDFYRVKLMLAHANSDDLGKASELLADLGKAGPNLLAQQITQSVHDHQTSLERRLAAMETGCLVLEHLAEADPKSDASWAPSVRQAIANQMHSSGNWLPSLYAKGTSPNYGRQAKKELAEKRQRLHARFCDAMLKFGSSACDGFAGLYAAERAAQASKKGDSDEKQAEEGRDFLAVARQAVIDYEPPRPGNPYGHNHVVYYNNQSNHRLISPIEYLVASCAESGDWGLIDDEILPSIKDSGRSSIVRVALKQFRELYTCEPSEFLDKAEDFSRRWRTRPVNAPGSENKPEMIVLDCYDRRGLTIDMTPLFDKLLKSSAQVYGNNQSWWTDYASHLAEQGGSDAAAAWIEKIAKELLGPRERRAKHIATHYSNNGWSHNSPNGRMHEFEQLLRQMANKPDLVLPMLRFLREAEVGPLAKNAIRTLRNSSSRVRRAEPEAIVAMLESAGVLGEAAELPLDPLQGAATGEGSSLMDVLAAQFTNLGGDKKKRVRALLEKRDDQTIGVLLMTTKLANNPDETRKCCEPLLARLDELSKLEGDQAFRVARQLAASTASVRNRLSGSDEAKKWKPFFDWIDKQQERSSDSQLERLAKLRRFEELGIEGHELDEWLVETLAPLTKSNPEAAATTFLRICELFDDAQRRGTTHYSFGSRSTATHMLSQMPWRWRRVAEDDPAGPLRLVLAIASRKEGRSLPLSQNAFNQFGQQARQAMDRAIRLGNGGRSDAKEAASKRLDWLVQQFGDSYSPLLGYFYGERFNRLNAKELEAHEKWYTEAAGRENEVESRFAEDLLAWVRIARLKRTARNNRQKTDRAESGEPFTYFEAALADEQIPLAARTGIANLVARQRQGGIRLPISTAKAIAEVSIAACEGGVRLDQEIEQSFCNNAHDLLTDDPNSPEAAAFCDAWIKRYLGSPSRRKNNRGGSPNRLESWPGMLRFMTVCLERDRIDDVKKLLKTYQGNLNNRHEAIALLARNGLIDEAAKLSRAGWRKLPLSTDGRSGVYYDSKLEASLPLLRDKLGRPLGYVIEAAIARLPDPKKDQANQPEQRREDRLVSVAGRFDEAGLSSEEMIETALLMLRDSEDATDLVGQRLAKTAAKRKLFAVPHQHNPVLDRIAELHKQHAMWALRQGDASPAIKFIDTVAVDDDGQFWQLRNLYSRHSGDIWKGTLKQLDSLDEKQLEQVAEHTLKIMKRGKFDWSSRYGNLRSLAATTHIRLERSDKMIEAIKELGNQQKQMFKNNGQLPVDWELINSDLQPGDAATLEQRVQRLASLWSIASAAEWRMMENQLVRRGKLRDRDLKPWKAFFTDEELATAALMVAEKADSPNGLAWASAGLVLMHRGEYLLAAAAWEEAHRLTGKQNKAPYAAKRIESLLDAGETEVAAELYLATFREEKPSGWVKGLYDRLTKRLGDSIKPKQETAPTPEAEAEKEDDSNAAAEETTPSEAPEPTTVPAAAAAAVPSAA